VVDLGRLISDPSVIESLHDLPRRGFLRPIGSDDLLEIAIALPNNRGHGSLTVEKLTRMLLEDFAATMRGDDSWQAGHMALVLSQHGYRL